MSKYYKVKDLKVRVSDHEPNCSLDFLRTATDVELYVRSADNQLLSIEAQLERICERRGYEISDFESVLNDWKDGTYSKNIFKSKISEDEECFDLIDHQSSTYQILNERQMSFDEKLKAYSLSPFARHKEIKNLSEKTGISQSYIKKHFGIR